MLRWPHRRFDPRSLCDGKRRRFGVARVLRQERRHNGICEQIGYHRPFGHTVVPIQGVLWKLAAVPHFFQLRLFVRPASSALHVNVDVHGFSSVREKPRNDEVKGSVRIQERFRSPPFTNFCANRPFFLKEIRWDSGHYSRSRACKLRGGPKISRRMMASRRPAFEASKAATSVFNPASLAIGRVAAA